MQSDTHQVHQTVNKDALLSSQVGQKQSGVLLQNSQDLSNLIQLDSSIPNQMADGHQPTQANIQSQVNQNITIQEMGALAQGLQQFQAPAKQPSESMNHAHNLHLNHASVRGLPGQQSDLNQQNGCQMKQDLRNDEIVKGQAHQESDHTHNQMEEYDEESADDSENFHDQIGLKKQPNKKREKKILSKNMLKQKQINSTIEITTGQHQHQGVENAHNQILDIEKLAEDLSDGTSENRDENDQFKSPRQASRKRDQTRHKFPQADEQDEDFDQESAHQTLTAKSEAETMKQVPGQTFQKHQTKVLQKWFLDNIHHPYLKKDDKARLAQQTGLTKKQITGWFTNNRKRKYQKVAAVAKKKNKDISYIREIVKMKFDKDMDQSLSDSMSNCSSQSSDQQQKQGQVNQFANKVWGNQLSEARKYISFNQMNKTESKSLIQVNPLMQNFIIQGEPNFNTYHIGVGTPSKVQKLQGDNFEFCNLNILKNDGQQSNQQLMLNDQTQQQIAQNPLVHQQAVKGTVSNFTFNSQQPFEQIPRKNIDSQQQAPQDSQAAANIQNKEQLEALNILQNFQKLMDTQKQDSIEKPSSSPPSKLPSCEQEQTYDIDKILKQHKDIQFIPIMYIQYLNGNSEYEPLFEVQSQICKYLNFQQEQLKRNQGTNNSTSLAKNPSVEKSKSAAKENAEGQDDEDPCEQKDDKDYESQMHAIEDYLSTVLSKFHNAALTSAETGTCGSNPQDQRNINMLLNMRQGTFQNRSASIAQESISTGQPKNGNLTALITSQNPVKNIASEQIKKLLIDTMVNLQKGNSTSNNGSQQKAQSFPDVTQQQPKFQSMPKQIESSNTNNIAQQTSKSNNAVSQNQKSNDPLLMLQKTQFNPAMTSNNTTKGFPETTIANASKNNVGANAIIQKLKQLQEVQMLNQQMPQGKNLFPQNANEANSNAAQNAQTKALETGGNQAGENNATDNKQMLLNGSHLNSLNSWLGLAGSVNIGYPSSYTYPNNSNGSVSNIGGSQGLSGVIGSIIGTGSGQTSGLPNSNMNSNNSNESQSSNHSGGDKKANKSQESPQNEQNSLAPEKQDDAKAKDQNHSQKNQGGTAQNNLPHPSGKNDTAKSQQINPNPKLVEQKTSMDADLRMQERQDKQGQAILLAFQRIKNSGLDLIGFLENYIKAQKDGSNMTFDEVQSKLSQNEPSAPSVDKESNKTRQKNGNIQDNDNAKNDQITKAQQSQKNSAQTQQNQQQQPVFSQHRLGEVNKSNDNNSSQQNNINYQLQQVNKTKGFFQDTPNTLSQVNFTDPNRPNYDSQQGNSGLSRSRSNQTQNNQNRQIQNYLTSQILAAGTLSNGVQGHQMCHNPAAEQHQVSMGNEQAANLHYLNGFAGNIQLFGNMMQNHPSNQQLSINQFNEQYSQAQNFMNANQYQFQSSQNFDAQNQAHLSGTAQQQHVAATNLELQNALLGNTLQLQNSAALQNQQNATQQLQNQALMNILNNINMESQPHGGPQNPQQISQPSATGAQNTGHHNENTGINAYQQAQFLNQNQANYYSNLQ